MTAQPHRLGAEKEEKHINEQKKKKSTNESMSFITELICKFIFTDVHMRNNYRPNRA